MFLIHFGINNRLVNFLIYTLKFHVIGGNNLISDLYCSKQLSYLFVGYTSFVVYIFTAQKVKEFDAKRNG